MGTDIEDKDKPTAVWFRMARASQTMDDGAGGQRPWTVDELRAHMQAEIGWAPGRTNYSTYEQGHTVPLPATLAKFYRFWKRYGIEPPDLNPPSMGTSGEAAQPSPDVLALLEKLDRQADVIDAQAKAISGLADQIQALAGTQPTGEELANVLAGAVTLAVRETLRAAGFADGPRPK